MPKQHTYVLGLNTYDHDVSACLLRDGAIAFAIGKERLTREKHASGFYKEVIDYCLEAEGITIDDVDLVVTNSYVLPVPDMEEQLAFRDMPGFLPPPEREQAEKHPVFRAKSDKVVTVSHHLAHAYSAFAASPFEEGAVMIVDGVGSYRADAMEKPPGDDAGNPLARESESYYRFSGQRARMPEKSLAGAVPRPAQRGILQHAGARRAVQPRLDLRVRRLEQVRRVDGARALWPPRPGQVTARYRERRIARAGLDQRIQAAVPGRSGRLGKAPGDAALGGYGLAGSGRYRKRAAGADALAARDDRRKEPLHRRRRGAELRRQRPHRAGRGIRERLDPAGGRRRRHCDRLCLLWLARRAEAAPHSCDGARLYRPHLWRARDRGHAAEAAGAHPDQSGAQRQYLPRDGKAARRSEGDRLVPGAFRVRAARARQSQPDRRSSQGGNEGHPQQPRQAPAGVPAVRADRAGRADEGCFRGRGGLAVHADRQTRARGMARQNSGHRPCRRHGAGADRARGDQPKTLSPVERVRGADRRSRADQHLIQRQGRADRRNA